MRRWLELSFHVTRRTHELGVRMGLGAPRRHVLGLMLTMGGRLVLIGLAIGVAASLASTRLLRSQLFGVQPADPSPTPLLPWCSVS
jgi:putative ABC transport system permease protein